MSLIPEGLTGEELIYCEWKILLHPQCPYVKELIMMTQTLLIFSVVCAVFMGVVLIIRYKVQKCHILAKRRRNPLLFVVPIEALFIASWVYAFIRIVQSVILLYYQDVVPLFVRGFLFAISFVVGASAVIYYWIALVAALPQDKIQDNSRILRKMTTINTIIGFAIILVFQTLPILEGFSSHYTLTNELLARKLLTASYSIWAITLFIGTVGVKLFGRKILNLLGSSLKLHKDKAVSRETPVFRALSKSYASMKPSVILCSSLLNSNVPVVIILAVARYYIWNNSRASLLFSFALNIVPGFFTLIFYTAIIVIDIREGRKNGQWLAPASNTMQSSQADDVRSGTGNPTSRTGGHERNKSSPSEKGAFELDEPIVSLAVSVQKSPDELMEEFCSSVKH